MKSAVYPGSFDPVTIGHLDIITRSSAVFSKLYVVVVTNPNKRPMFSHEERLVMLRKVTGHLPNVEVLSYEGLLVDCAREYGASVVVKGLRAVSDYEYEFQMALANRKLAPEIETVFLPASAENMFLSSSAVKQIGYFGGDISGLVPPEVKDMISERLIGKEEK